MTPEHLRFHRGKCENANAVLRRYDGGYVQFWNYTVSHGKLTIRITPEGGGHNCEIICGDCLHILSGTAWESARIRVELDVSRNEYVLVDDSAGAGGYHSESS